MTALLYDRVVRVTLARPSGFFTQEANAIVITDLQVEFSMEKALKSSPNTAEIKILNLAERTRGEVSKARPLHVKVEAGYDGQLQRIFEGDAIHALSSHSGTEWVTTLQVKDGGRAYAHARVSKAYVAGAQLHQVVGDIAGAMGLTVAPATLALPELAARFAVGVVAHGPAAAEMTKILRSRGVSWSIQDGHLQILANDGGFRPGEAPIISEDAGMIGEPEWNIPRKKGEAPTLGVACQLYPGILPGGRVVVRSRAVSGTFKVIRVAHRGQCPAGADWTTEIEAKPL